MEPEARTCEATLTPSSIIVTDNMKTKHLVFATIVALLLPALAWAQGIAVYNSATVLAALPEKQQAEATLAATSAQLQGELQQMQDEFNRKYADFQALDASTSATIRDRRMQELQQADQRIRDFEQQAARALEQQRDELMAPIRDLIDAAVREVGDEASYDVILDIATTPVAYRGANTPDVTDKVLQKLGIK